jgi:hypothetical protein
LNLFVERLKHRHRQRKRPRWLPGGKAFRVHKPDPFIETIVPIYFKKQRKYKSFQKQLKYYGFQRIVAGHDKG